MADRTVSRRVKVTERGPGPVLGGTGVDRDDAVAGRDERQIAEVVALGDLDTGSGVEDPGRGEAEPVLGGHPEAAEHQLGVCRGRAEVAEATSRMIHSGSLDVTVRPMVAATIGSVVQVAISSSSSPCLPPVTA